MSGSKIAWAAPTADAEDDQSRAALFYEFIEKPAEDRLRETITSFKLPRAFTFPRDTEKDDKGHSRQGQRFGVDVSHHNGENIRFDLFRPQGIFFVYMKAGQGRRADRRFDKNWEAVGRLKGTRKLYRGAYFFLSSQMGGAEQGGNFAKIIGPLRPNDLPPVIDLEWHVVSGMDQWVGKEGRSIIDEVLACSQAVKEGTGRQPMIYTNASWLNERVPAPSQVARLSGHLIWLADHSISALGIESPTIPLGLSHKLWQFTDRAQVSNGYDFALDASIYRGTDDQFRTDFDVTPL
jgi:GH25 family lysozyme M1 (1,4-beta-N-acetylmuramidase)